MIIVKNRWLCSILVIVILLGGCNGNQSINSDKEDGKYQVSMVQQDQTIAKEAEQKVLKIEEVTEAVAVNVDKKILLGFRVKQFSKFRIKQIEKKVNEALKKHFPEYDTTASSDIKINIETMKIKNRLKTKDYQTEKFKKDVEKIQKLSREQT